ncbi:MAG: hypothetical protein HKO71_02920, partial [Pseudomonadales bacterium]|nr:hypothetical protein [Gammaproteobacteria bacterium]NNL56679.1 hypothetical protein [Pseudomonadales bacterium]
MKAGKVCSLLGLVVVCAALPPAVAQLDNNKKDAFNRKRAALENIVQQCGLDYRAQQLRVDALARVTNADPAQGGAPLVVNLQHGRQCRLVKVVDGRPYYYVGDNRSAADTISTDEVTVGGSRGTDLDGSGVPLGLWDQYNVWTSHIELSGQVTNRDGAIASNHATHVAGTLVAQGIDSQARGMAPG